MKKKIVSICMVIVGVIFCIFGTITLFNKDNINIDKPIIKTVSNQEFWLDEADVSALTDNYEINNGTFGADFYTYIYKGVVEAVDALDSINSQLARASYADQAIYDGLRISVEAQNETNYLLKKNLDATNQFTVLTYEIGMQEIEIDTTQNSIILFSVGAAFIFYGLFRLSETTFTFKKWKKGITIKEKPSNMETSFTKD